MTRPSPELLARVTDAIRARGGAPEGDELRFPCVAPEAHAHGDAHPSARWHPSKAVWHCDVCARGGGALDLARRLGITAEGDGPHGRNGRETVYVLRDADGAVVAHHVRLDTPSGKRMWWRRPDGSRGLGGRKTRTLPLYRGETLQDLAADAPVVLTEGERAADALAARGIETVGTVTGAAGTPADDVLRALVGRDAVIWPDADGPGRDHMARIAARLVALGTRPRWFDPDHEATDGRDAADDSRDADTLRAALAAAPVWTSTEDAGKADTSSPSPPTAAAREGAADALVRLALELLELWHDPDGEPYVTLAAGDHREHHALRSRTVRSFLARMYYVRTRRSVRGEAMTEALGVLEGLARYEGETHAVAVRLAEHEGRIYLDLADAAWRAVEVTAAGWRVVADPPVRFRRPRGQRALPEPATGATLDELRTVLPVVETEHWHLLAAWVLSAFRPHGPYPVLCLHGEAGAAKSTTARILRSLIDPALAPLRSAPRDDRDLVIAASNGHVIALDNLSHVPPWLSDALCRLATGGGYATRTLYSDTDETVLDVQRPIILTGIEELAVRGDLADRALVVTLPAIADSARMPEAALMAQVDALRPRVLGALLDAVSCGLRELPHTRLDRLPRLADAALWWTACERALPWAQGCILAAHEHGRGEAAATTLEASPVGAALLELLAERSEWDGTAATLLAALAGHAPEATVRDRHRWPQSPRGLTGALRRLAPALRRAGVTVEWLPRSNQSRPVRLVRAATVTTVTSVTTSASSRDFGDGRSDGRGQPSRQPSRQTSSIHAADDGGDGSDGPAAILVGTPDPAADGDDLAAGLGDEVLL